MIIEVTQSHYKTFVSHVINKIIETFICPTQFTRTLDTFFKIKKKPTHNIWCILHTYVY
jgi:hypothetical protein